MVIKGYTNYQPTLPATVVIGNFDGVHLGHQQLIRQAVQAAHEFQGTALALTFDPHPLHYFAPDKAPPLLTSLERKIELLLAAGLDTIIVQPFDQAFAQLSPREFIQRVLTQLGTKHLFVGADVRFGHKRAGDYALLEQSGTEFGYSTHVVPQLEVDGEAVSSSRIRQAIATSNTELVKRLLGRDTL